MRNIFYMFKDSSEIVFDLIWIAIAACIFPFGVALYALFTVPKIIATHCKRFSILIGFASSLAFLYFATYSNYIYTEATMPFSEFLEFSIMYAISKSILAVVALVVLLTVFLTALIYFFFLLILKLDEYVCIVFYFPITIIPKRVKSIIHHFDMLTFNSYDKKEDYEVYKFRKDYNLPPF